MSHVEVLKQMVEALDVASSCLDGYYIPLGKSTIPEIEEAIAAGRQAIAEAEKQEPVAWLHKQGNFTEACMNALHDDEIDRGWTQEPLYTSPPQRQPLTDAEIDEIWSDHGLDGLTPRTFARAIEAAHGIKENT